MPLPLAGVAASALAPLLQQVFRWFVFSMAAKAVLKIMAHFGVALATNKLLIQPLLDMVVSKWHSMPVELSQWLGALGIDVVVSILISAYSIEGLSRVFLVKK